LLNDVYNIHDYPYVVKVSKRFFRKVNQINGRAFLIYL